MEVVFSLVEIRFIIKYYKVFISKHTSLGDAQKQFNVLPPVSFLKYAPKQ